MSSALLLSGFPSVRVHDGVVAQLALEAWRAHTPLTSCHAGNLGGAEGRKAVQGGGADMDFGGLAAGVSFSDSRAESFQAAHPPIDPAADMVYRPAHPECPNEIPRCARGFVSDACRWAVFFSQAPVLADRNDRNGITLNDGLVAAARIVGAIAGDWGDLLMRRDLADQVRVFGPWPSRLGANSTARISDAARSRARWALSP